MRDRTHSKLPSARERTDVAGGDAVSAFLKEVDAAPTPQKALPVGRIIFALDATMSRAPTWKVARQVQAEMFAAADEIGTLEVQVVFFRGQSELRKSKWIRSGATLADQMSRVQCRSGLTQIGRVLRHSDQEAQREDVAALIYIGDAVEENPDRLGDLAAQLAMRNVKIFAFQEGHDARVAAVFKELARITQGAFAQFDSDSPARLRALMRAVGAYAAGGFDALVQLAQSNDTASSLLKQIPKHRGSPS